jgi:hypothetical protein
MKTFPDGIDVVWFRVTATLTGQTVFSFDAGKRADYSAEITALLPVEMMETAMLIEPAVDNIFVSVLVELPAASALTPESVVGGSAEDFTSSLSANLLGAGVIKAPLDSNVVVQQVVQDAASSFDALFGDSLAAQQDSRLQMMQLLSPSGRSPKQVQTPQSSMQDSSFVPNSNGVLVGGVVGMGGCLLATLVVYRRRSASARSSSVVTEESMRAVPSATAVHDLI